jgi:hypothetical protein
MTLYGSPSTENYTLGRGVLSMAAWSGETPPSSLVDVGVCNRCELEVTEEKLDHFSRRSGARVKDKIAVIETGYNITFTLDENSVANMKAFIRATQGGQGVLHANQNPTAEYRIWFISDNSEGPNATYRFHKVRLLPAAALSLIGDDWSGLQFRGEGLADTTNNPSSPFFDVIYSGCTTTTTTSSTSTTSTTSTA